jgi:hypothetical protein
MATFFLGGKGRLSGNGDKSDNSVNSEGNNYQVQRLHGLPQVVGWTHKSNDLCRTKEMGKAYW